jgi:Zn-finger nucleic acid-binding protein
MRKYEAVVCIGSDERTKLISSILDSEVISIVIGSSPITEDKWVDPGELRKILRAVKSARS